MASSDQILEVQAVRQSFPRGAKGELLVLDEPFESVDPVSAANIEDVLRGYTASGGSVIVSSHSMDLVQRMCDHVAVIAAGRVLAAGTVDEVRDAFSRALALQSRA